MPKTPILLLAAGESSRMSKPKQLLPWGERTLFEHAIATALHFKNHPLFVVLGAYHEQLLPLIPSKTVTAIINPQWKEGMGTSIAAGIKAIRAAHTKASGVMIILVDQPLIDPPYLRNFLKKIDSNKKKIIASSYPDGRLGVPAFFDAVYFSELMAFSKDQGARKLIKKYRNHVTSISRENLLTDIDTPEAYQKLLSQFPPIPQS